MKRYISILRGINVSGKNKILMADLKTLFEKLGFNNVTTYIQSGNVVFDANANEENKSIERKIQSAIFAQYVFEVPVLVRTFEEIEQTIAINPFLKIENINTDKLYVTFLQNIPSNEQLKKVKDLNFLPDQFEIIGKEVFVYCPDKYGTTKLSNQFFENKLKVSATTRNWKTTIQLKEMVKGNINF